MVYAMRVPPNEKSEHCCVEIGAALLFVGILNEMWLDFV